MKLYSSSWVTFVIVLTAAALTPVRGLAHRVAEPARRDAHSLQVLVDELGKELSIRERVEAAIVETNPLLVSVEPRRRDSVFQLSFDREFLDTLDEGDVRAAIAHELGHVWIFTNHPYLQTERLANDVAMRAVTRESLLKVYEKVWARIGTKVDAASFVGQ